MYPVLLEIGPIKLHTYGFMIAMGFIAALFFMQRDARRTGLDADAIGTMAFWSLFLGIVGTRVLHIVMYPEAYSWRDPIGWINLTRGGLVFQGAIPFVLIYTYFEIKRRKMPFLAVADVVFPYVPLAHAFGRIGCFFYGCCFGMRADQLPWAIRFPSGSPAYLAAQGPLGLGAAEWSHPVHPTQLYSVLGLATICVTLLLLRKHWKPFAGFTFPLYFVLYGILRFIVESFRGDSNPTGLGFGVLTDQQVFSVAGIVVGAILFIYLRGRDARLGSDNAAD